MTHVAKRTKWSRLRHQGGGRFEERPMEGFGYRRLAAAMLHRAVEDCRNGERVVRTDAELWLCGRDSGLSFEVCCELLGRDPERLRRRLLQRLPISRPPKYETTAGLETKRAN